MGLEKLRLRSQQLPVTNIVNGSLYIASVSHLLQHRSFFGDSILGLQSPRGPESLDIDVEDDFCYAEYLVKKYLLESLGQGETPLSSNHKR